MNATHAAALKLVEKALLAEEGLAEEIARIQHFIWHDLPEHDNSSAAERLRDLAYDLEYFEPDPLRCSAEPALYGEAKARGLLSEAVSNIRKSTTA